MIKVQIDKLTSDLATLKTAIGEFETYTKNFTTQCMSQLEGQNSDFVEAAKDHLDGMTYAKIPKLLEKINTFHDNGVALVSTFKETDENIAASEKLNG